MQPYEYNADVPCTLIGVRRCRYEALLQVPCYKVGSEPTFFEQRRVQEAKASTTSKPAFTLLRMIFLGWGQWHFGHLDKEL